MAEIEFHALTFTDSDERGEFTELDELVVLEATYHDIDGDVAIVTMAELEDLIGWEAIEAIEAGMDAVAMECMV
jgi:hypothetical protein